MVQYGDRICVGDESFVLRFHLPDHTGGGRNHRHVGDSRGVPELGHDVAHSRNLVDVPIERVDDDESDRRVGVVCRPNQVGHVLDRHRGIEDPQRQRTGLINRPRHGLPVTLTQTTIAKATPRPRTAPRGTGTPSPTTSRR